MMAARSYAEVLAEALGDRVRGVLRKSGLLAPAPVGRRAAAPQARLPLPALDRERGSLAGWRVGSGTVFQAAGAPPPPGGAGDGPSLWVSDPRTGLAVAYAVPVDGELAALAALRPGGWATGLSLARRAALADIGALRPADEPPIDLEAERAPLIRGLDTDGFAVIRDLVSPGLRAALAAHYLALPHQVQLESSRLIGRQVEIAEPVARHLLHGLTGLVGALAGRAVQPACSFAAWYGPGARLRIDDHAACAYALHLVIDQQPARASYWPLRLTSRRGQLEELHLEAGDAVVFRGREPVPPRRKSWEHGNAIGVLLHYTG